MRLPFRHPGNAAHHTLATKAGQTSVSPGDRYSRLAQRRSSVSEKTRPANVNHRSPLPLRVRRAWGAQTPTDLPLLRIVVTHRGSARIGRSSRPTGVVRIRYLELQGNGEIRRTALCEVPFPCDVVVSLSDHHRETIQNERRV
jgi:hypothetical protein